MNTQRASNFKQISTRMLIALLVLALLLPACTQQPGSFGLDPDRVAQLDGGAMRGDGLGKIFDADDVPGAENGRAFDVCRGNTADALRPLRRELLDVLEESLAVYLNHPDIIGTAVAQFADSRVTDEFWSTRPRMSNNKGTLDEFRRRSENLYERVRALFFLYAIHRFHLPDRLRDANGAVGRRSLIPFKGYEHLLQRRFEEAIDRFLAVQQAEGPSDAISSALGSFDFGRA